MDKTQQKWYTEEKEKRLILYEYEHNKSQRWIWEGQMNKGIQKKKTKN